MGTINFPGLATGIDTSKIIEQLMAINTRRLANYQVKQKALQTKSTDFDELKANVSAFEAATAALADSSNLDAFKATSSDGNRLGIAATSDANPGSHSVLINQLATSETWTQDTSTFSHDTDYVGPGNFIYSYNHQERIITTTSTTTLADLAGLINNDEKNPGCTASLLNQGGKYHLMLSGQSTGEDYQISIDSTSTEVWKPDANQANSTFTNNGDNATLDTKIIDLDQWVGPHTGAETITISGKNHSGNTILPARSLNIASDTTLDHLVNEINDYYEGVATATLDDGQIVLTDHTAGASGLQISLSFNANGSAATLGLPTMAVSAEGGSSSATVSSLAASTFVQTQAAQDAQIKIDNYVPTKVREVQTLRPNARATGGTFTLSFGGQTTSLSYDASLTDIQTALNALSTVTAAGGVTVAGSPLNTNPANSMTFTFAASAGNVGMISVGAGSLTGPTSVTVEETTRGNSDEWISRNSNIISDAVTGLTLTLQDVNDVDANKNPIPITISVSRDTASVRSKVDQLVSTYNTLLAYLKKKTDYDSTTKKMGELSDDLTVTLIKTQMKEPFLGVVSGFSSNNTYTQAKDIGLTFDGSGNLQLNSDTFNNAIAKDYTNVVDLLGAAAKGNSDSTAISFYQGSDKFTTAGQYEVQATVAAQGGTKYVQSAQIRTAGDTTWRDMSVVGNLLIGNSDFDGSGTHALYPENGMYLTIDLSNTGTFTSTIQVKRGMANSLDTTLNDIVKSGGRLDTLQTTVEDQISNLDNTISAEQTRLAKVQSDLEAKFARLEKTITEYQQQLSSISSLLGK